MIQAFYEGDESLFHDKKIWAAGEEYRKEQGSHPVIFLTFKDIKQTTLEEAFEKLTTVVASEIGRYRESVENGLAIGAKRDSLLHTLARKPSMTELGESLGLLAVLREEFRVLSNVESGEGRFDIALKPLVEGFPAFIIEVKAADAPDEDLKALAREARRQIDGKKYDTTFRAEGIADIVKIGLAYYKDQVELRTEA